MVLGPGEYEAVRMLNSASLVLAILQKLMEEAHLTILKDLRYRKPAETAKWQLRSGYENGGTSPRLTTDIS